MDPKALASSFDRILAMRGDPAKGVGAPAWEECLAEVDKDALLRAVIVVVRQLLLPDWAARRKTDLRPQVALEAAEAWLASPTAEVIAQLRAAAKACTEARGATFGDDHRVPEAARHAAWAAAAKEVKAAREALHDALATVEAELLARIALTSEYHRGPEQRRAIVDLLRKELLPPEPAAPPPVPVSTTPIPYSPETHFELGQRIAHKKFGEVSVVSVGETWIEVEIPGGEKKRLAHKP